MDGLDGFVGRLGRLGRLRGASSGGFVTNVFFILVIAGKAKPGQATKGRKKVSPVEALEQVLMSSPVKNQEDSDSQATILDPFEEPSDSDPKRKAAGDYFSIQKLLYMFLVTAFQEF